MPSPSHTTLDISAEYSVENLVVREMAQLGEAHDPLVEPDPLVHLAELDVADDVIDRLDAEPLRAGRIKLEAGEEDTRVFRP